MAAELAIQRRFARRAARARAGVVLDLVVGGHERVAHAKLDHPHHRSERRRADERVETADVALADEREEGAEPAVLHELAPPLHARVLVLVRVGRGGHQVRLDRLARVHATPKIVPRPKQVSPQARVRSSSVELLFGRLGRRDHLQDLPGRLASGRHLEKLEEGRDVRVVGREGVARGRQVLVRHLAREDVVLHRDVFAVLEPELREGLVRPLERVAEERVAGFGDLHWLEDLLLSDRRLRRLRRHRPRLRHRVVVVGVDDGRGGHIQVGAAVLGQTHGLDERVLQHHVAVHRELVDAGHLLPHHQTQLHVLALGAAAMGGVRVEFREPPEVLRQHREPVVDLPLVLRGGRLQAREDALQEVIPAQPDRRVRERRQRLLRLRRPRVALHARQARAVDGLADGEQREFRALAQLRRRVERRHRDRLERDQVVPNNLDVLVLAHHVGLGIVAERTRVLVDPHEELQEAVRSVGAELGHVEAGLGDHRRDVVQHHRARGLALCSVREVERVLGLLGGEDDGVPLQDDAAVLLNARVPNQADPIRRQRRLRLKVRTKSAQQGEAGEERRVVDVVHLGGAGVAELLEDIAEHARRVALVHLPKQVGP
mmetsp:Transcript_15676/g.28155  ORF Transcript_15676/g.28155 Transcript_15676/m.28155 type:complete len:602 (+) Transcript_15676:4306-6111(+)